MGETLSDKKRIDIDLLFNAVESTDFFREIPAFLNNRVVSYTIKIIKAAMIILARGLLS
jgi:hypothetical protein